MDYKEILTRKINEVKSLLYTYKDKLEDDEFNSIRVMVENATLSMDGRLDSLDYDVRDEAIMNWHSKLDNAIRSLKKFDEKEIEK